MCAPGIPAKGLPGWRCGFDAVVAARRSGFTELPCGTCGGPSWGWGVWAPVPTGVEKFEGSSEVNMVAEDGEIRYLEMMVCMRASRKPDSTLVA